MPSTPAVKQRQMEYVLQLLVNLSKKKDLNLPIFSKIMGVKTSQIDLLCGLKPILKIVHWIEKRVCIRALIN
jgi:hypothetical protein